MSILKQFNLEGQAAFITGGNRGLGLEIGKALAEAGANIAIASRDENKNAEAAQIIRDAYPVKVLHHKCDILKKEDIASAVAKTKDAFGRIDILVNSAGINIRGKIETLAFEDFDTVMGVNVTGSWGVAREIVPIMKENGYGRILNISSMLGAVAIPERTPYATSKGAILQLTRSLAVEVARDNINVNVILPGPFDTEIFEPVKKDPEKFAAFCNNIPLGRIGGLDEIGALALYLCSPASSFVTGSLISIDGGWLAQ
ncbi:MAG: glucose 1-dehydrogenase [Bacteroidota bacterium]